MAKNGNGKRQAKYQLLLPLLSRKQGANAKELLRAINSKDLHDLMNTIQTARLKYSVSRKVVGDESRWFVRGAIKTPSIQSAVKGKTTAKNSTKPKATKPKTTKAKSTKPAFTKTIKKSKPTKSMSKANETPTPDSNAPVQSPGVS